MWNSVHLLGRLTKDPELRYLESGNAVLSFTVAIEKPYFLQKDGEQNADFIPIVVWGKKAETGADYLRKGFRVFIDGRLSTRNYEKEDGTRVYITEVVADDFKFLDFPEREEQQPEPQPERPQNNQRNQNSQNSSNKSNNSRNQSSGNRNQGNRR